MKKILFPILLAFCCTLTNCGTKDEAATDTTTTLANPEPETNDTTETAGTPAAATETPTETKELETAATSTNPAGGDCDKFLTDYEEFVDSYAAVAAKYAKNPSDLTIMKEYSEMATKSQEMQGNKPDACEADAAFMKRYTRIAAKMTKAAAAQAAGSAKMMEQMSKQMGQ